MKSVIDVSIILEFIISLCFKYSKPFLVALLKPTINCFQSQLSCYAMEHWKLFLLSNSSPRSVNHRLSIPTFSSVALVSKILLCASDWHFSYNLEVNGSRIWLSVFDL